MIKQRHIKRACVILIVIGIVMVAQNFFIEPHHLKKASNTFVEHFEVFDASDLTTYNTGTPFIKPDLKPSILRNHQLYNSKTVIKSPKKRPTFKSRLSRGLFYQSETVTRNSKNPILSKCGYNVSSY